jgi:hypothetical protein
VTPNVWGRRDDVFVDLVLVGDVDLDGDGNVDLSDER